jgi:methionine synthase II (cobalamin-independent)
MGEKGSPTGEVAEASDELHLKKDVNDSEDSPVMGLLTGHKTTKSGTEENEISGNNEAPSESTIKKAIRKRASYVKANSEYVTPPCKFVTCFFFFFGVSII